MQAFSKRIYVELGYSPEFFFNRICTVNGVRFYVHVIDNYNDSFSFNMEEQNGRWKTINAPKIPDWIMNVEKQLEDAIFESLIC